MSRRARQDNDRGNDQDTAELAAAVQDLAAIVERLRDEVETLRQAVDDLREEWTHELRQLRDALPLPAEPPPYRLDSMPQDPCAEDFEERINTFDASVFEPPEAEASPAAISPRTVDELVAPLLRPGAANIRTADDLGEDQDLPPGEVFVVDAWIDECVMAQLVTAWEADDWTIADDGLGSLYLVWWRDERTYVRRFTESQQQEFCRLTGAVLDVETDDEALPPASPPAPCRADCEPPAAQQTLW